MELVGREKERDAAVRSVRFGNGAVIVGDAGVGKSALAGAVADVIGVQEVPVVKLLATAASRTIPYAALAPLVPSDSTDLHPALVPGLVLRRLVELGGKSRPLLVVDDAHWLDDHSASALLTVIGQRGTRAVLTVRSGGRPSAAVTALWKERMLDRIDLRPLNVTEAGALLRARLGGDVAAMTTQLLWERSRGNALYLTELARYGVATGRLTATNGLWWWSGSADVPPRLAELLVHRLDDLTPVAAEAVDILALGEPLPYDTLAAACSAEAILELDRDGFIVSDASAGVVRVQISHPLLLDVAAHRLSAARRRALAQRLLSAPADHVDLLRRATWQDAAGGRPDVGLLVRASRSLIVLDPSVAIRFAERALPYDDGPSAAVTLADAQAELGMADLARNSLHTARTRIRHAADQASVGLSEASLSLWSLRRPADALDILDRLATELPPELVDEARSATALLTLFTARPAEAAEIAEQILMRGPDPPARRRCLLVRLAAATLADRPSQSLAALAELADVLRQHPQPASALSMSTAIAATAELFANTSAELPRAGGRSGRWPAPDRSMDIHDRTGASPLAGPAWPLLDGVRHHLAGDYDAAAVALREATVQQLQGEGLFRSEAIGGLVVVLAESGRLDEARKVLADNGPDDVAVIPGMRGWAQAWLLARSGRVRAAGELAAQTAREAAGVGALTTAMWYLADASRMGAQKLAADIAESLAGNVGSNLSSARLLGIRARADGRSAPLLAAAEAHLSVGMFGHAAELAELAAGQAARSDTRTAGSLVRRAGEVAAHAGAALGLSASSGKPRLPVQLTRREAEIARLAAQGLRDKDIADELVLSVRTVESHLASTYRKLHIASRRDLIAALEGGRATL
ncbi:MAG TPA: LuxR C-terminal-related transcriptional regulator [Nakamurella sp.]